jgi:thermolabile hemolysin
MKVTIVNFPKRSNHRSCVARLTVALLLWQCAHGFLRGASSSSSSSSEDGESDEKSSAWRDDPPPSADATCPAIERASGVQYSSMVVFGDSYSDTGNIWRASNRTQPPSPPYYDGRYSNGRNYVDFVSEALLSSLPFNNYAWGGATSNNNIVPGYSTFLNATVPSFQDQVRAHLNQSTTAAGCSSLDDDTDRDSIEFGPTLYIAVIGYNDYWWYANENVTTNTTRRNMEDFVDLVVTSIIDSVQQLVTRPVRCRRDEGSGVVLVGDVPPMDLLPDARSKTETVRRAYKVLTGLHNAKLRELVSTLNNDDDRTAVRLLPVHETIVDLIHRAPCLGFDKASAACLGPGDGNGTTICDDPYRHLFLDDWHPMTWTHQRLAHAVLTATLL